MNKIIYTAEMMLMADERYKMAAELAQLYMRSNEFWKGSIEKDPALSYINEQLITSMREYGRALAAKLNTVCGGDISHEICRWVDDNDCGSLYGVVSTWLDEYQKETKETDMAYTLKSSYIVEKGSLDWGEDKVQSVSHTLYDENGKGICSICGYDMSECPEDANFFRGLKDLLEVPAFVKQCLKAGDIKFEEEIEEY